MPKRGSESQLTVAEESTWGTAVTTTRAYVYRSEGIEVEAEDIESQGIRAGRFNKFRSAASGGYVHWKKGGGGPIEMELMNKGFGLWFKHCLGTNTTTGGASPYTHTASIGSLTGDSLTVQKSLQDVPLTYLGCKVASFEISCEVGGLAMFTPTLDVKDEDQAIVLATATYPADLAPFAFLHGTLTVGGSAFLVNSITISGDNGLKTDRYKIRTSGLKDEQLDTGREFTGTMEADFESLTAYNRFVNGTEAALNFKLEGGIITGSDKFTITIDAPVITTTGTTPTVDSPDLIPQSLPFRIREDSLTIAVKTSEATP